MPQVWELFRPRQQQPQQPTGQQQPQNSQQVVDPSGNPQVQGAPGSSMQQPNPNSGVPQGNQQQNQQQTSPLDEFTSLWQTSDKDQQPVDPFSNPLLSLDPAKFAESTGKLDFLSNAPQELLQKAATGDWTAISQLMNHVGQQAFLYAGQLSTASVNKAGTDLGTRFKQAAPDMFKQFMLENQPEDNPVLSHPAAQPMLKFAMQQIKMKNPGLSATEIQKQARNYVLAFAKSLGPSGSGDDMNPDGTQRVQSKEQDWSTFLGNVTS